jgi:RHS repeat-associated protein
LRLRASGAIRLVAEKGKLAQTPWIRQSSTVIGTASFPSRTACGHTKTRRRRGVHTCTNIGTFRNRGRNYQVVGCACVGEKQRTFHEDPFGNIIRLTGTGTIAKDNPFRFSTKRTDDNTDLVLYEYRPYSPSLGRWTSRDPIGEEGGPNLYGFVRNRPVSLLDFLGLQDRTDDVVARYLDVNRDADPNNDMTVAQKVANIIADIYQEALNRHRRGIVCVWRRCDQIQGDVGDTFSSGSLLSPRNGRTTYATLSADGAASGFRNDFLPNRDDFARHLGDGFRYGSAAGAAFEAGDMAQGAMSSDPARQQESASEAAMDAAFRNLLMRLCYLADQNATRDAVYLDALNTLNHAGQ